MILNTPEVSIKKKYDAVREIARKSDYCLNYRVELEKNSAIAIRVVVGKRWEGGDVLSHASGP